MAKVIHKNDKVLATFEFLFPRNKACFEDRIFEEKEKGLNFELQAPGVREALAIPAVCLMSPVPPLYLPSEVPPGRLGTL